MKWVYFLLLCPCFLLGRPEIVCETSSLVDEKLSIEIIGLDPAQEIRVAASWVDGGRIKWASEGIFQANEKGIVDLGTQAPIIGTYEDIDPMGLFWSMREQNVVPLGSDDDQYIDNKSMIHPLRVYNENNEIIAEKVIQRLFIREDVTRIEVEEEGLIGTLFLPPSQDRLPLIVVLGGSSGGIPETTAAMIASHGFASLALAYCGIGNLPSDVYEIPLEYFEKAFEWIKNEPNLSGQIYLHGTSRGAELALILGSFFPERIQKIVAVAPSSVCLTANAWVYQGKSVLPAAPYFIDPMYDAHITESTRECPKSIRIHRERALSLERDRFDQASIPVEKIRCPLLLVTGGDDQMGPSTTYAKFIIERLEKKGSEIPRIHLDFPRAGHLIFMPYFPRYTINCVQGYWIDYGGTLKDNEWACREYWKQMLEFLNQ